MYLNLQKNGLRKQVKQGFSFTTLFFGVFVALSRGMWLQVIITMLTFGVANLYYMFRINDIYLERLIDRGWEVV